MAGYKRRVPRFDGELAGKLLQGATKGFMVDNIKDRDHARGSDERLILFHSIREYCTFQPQPLFAQA
jgi:hypothetical protein